MTGERRRSGFDLDGLASGVTAIKSCRELLLALGHPLMNDMKQMCERCRRRRGNDGEKVTAAHTHTHTCTHRRLTCEEFGWHLCVHTLQIATNTCFGAQTSAPANRRRCQNRLPSPNTRHLRTSRWRKKEMVTVSFRIERPRSYFPALFMCKMDPSSPRGDLRLPFTPTHSPTGIVHQRQRWRQFALISQHPLLQRILS